MSFGVRPSPFAAAVVLALSGTACVSKGTYDRAVADAAQARGEADEQHKRDASVIARLRAELTAAEAATQDRDAKISDLSTSRHNVQAELDEATAMNDQLRGELGRLGKDVDKILRERGTLAKAFDDAKSRLEELRKAQAAAEARAAVFQEMAQRLKALVDAGQLAVEMRRGRLVMELSSDLLFDAGHADVRTAGKGMLMEVARELQRVAPASSGRRFLVTAHADEAPPKGKRWRSSWELTAARAVSVVEYLVSLGVAPETLAAGAAGQFDPIAANDAPGAKAKNRRIEIALQPSADDVVAR
jgi:chemotaxis protein MotB